MFAGRTGGFCYVSGSKRTALPDFFDEDLCCMPCLNNCAFVLIPSRTMLQKISTYVASCARCSVQESTIRHTHRSVAAMFNVDTSSPHVSRPVQESEIDRVVVAAENSSSSSSGHLNVPFGWFWPCLLSLGRSCLFWRACGTSNVADQGGRICHRHKFRNDTSTKDSQPNCRCFILENVCGCLASSRSHDITDSTAYKAKQSLGPLGGTGW